MTVRHTSSLKRLEQRINVVLDDQTDVKRLRIPLPAGGLVAMAELALSDDTVARY